jgi:hypothetical protein
VSGNGSIDAKLNAVAGRAPTFFIVGTPKAGTTSLYHWCRQHPSIFMSPIKEPCYFAPEIAHVTERSTEAYLADRASLRRWLDGPRIEPRTRGLVLDWADYLSLFRDAGGAAAIGEVSGNYLASETAPAALSSRIPAARIVMMLRNPVDRLYSQFASARNAGDAEGSFGRWAEEQLRQESAGRLRFGPVSTGMYATHLRRWRRSFPDDQLRVFFYEDYTARPREVLAELFAFIGVDPDQAVDASQRHNVTTEPRWPALHRLVRPAAPWIEAALPMSIRGAIRQWTRRPATGSPTARERALIAEAYGADIEALEALVGRDLSHWRVPVPAAGPPAT